MYMSGGTNRAESVVEGKESGDINEYKGRDDAVMKGQDFSDSQEDKFEELDIIIGATVLFPGLKMES